MNCPRHPDGIISTDGDCYECAGRPPDWTCSVCGRKLPCGHVRYQPEPNMRCSDARAAVIRAIQAYGNLVGDFGAIDRTLDEYVRELRTAWRELLEKVSRN